MQESKIFVLNIRIIDLAVKHKVNKVNGIQFDVSKEEKKRLKDVLVE